MGARRAALLSVGSRIVPRIEAALGTGHSAVLQNDTLLFIAWIE